MDILQYSGQLVALIQPTIYTLGDYKGFKIFKKTDLYKCGLFYIKVEKDQFTDTVHVNLKPTYRDKVYFKEFSKDFTYNKNNFVITDAGQQKFFSQDEIFKSHGFVSFINLLLEYKYNVESYPIKYYIKYYNRKLYFKNNSWYLNDEKISEKRLLEIFFKIPWEYDNKEISIKKYNIFKRFFSIFKKTDNMLNNN